MKISTSELKRFKTNAAFIKPNKILPVLSFIKFDEGKITKTSLNSFIEQTVDFNGSMLVDENILFNFLNYTSEPTIDISEKKGVTTITDGKSTVSCPSEKVEHFPKTSKSEGEEIALSNDIMCAIKFASNFIDTMEAPDMRGHVFIGDGMVVGCNGTIGYTEKFKDKLPKVSLVKDVASSLGKLYTASFSENDRYTFWGIDDTVYGFIKPTYPYTCINQISQVDKNANVFEVSKSDILYFTEMCISSTKATWNLATMSINNGVLKLSMDDPDYGVDVKKDVTVSGSMEGVFNFNPKLMSTLLKNLPDEQLSFHQSKGSYMITGETGFISIIQQLQLLNQ